MRDLSIQNSMIDRNCTGVECNGCPNSIEGFSKIDCIGIRYASGLYFTTLPAKVMGMDVSRIIKILNHELERIFIDDYDYEVLCENKFPPGDSDYHIISIPQMQEILSIGKPVIEKFKVVFEDRPSGYIKPEWTDAVFKEFELYGEYQTLEDGSVKYTISRLYLDIQYAFEFLEKALAMNKPVELGRFDFKYRFQYL
jgi:hypothetical protein